MRELNQRGAQVIQLVTQGETIELTHRGRAIARIVPVTGHGEALARMVREGRAIAPSADRSPIPLPASFGEAQMSASDEVSADRARERW